MVTLHGAGITKLRGKAIIKPQYNTASRHD
jgi:hypothetical protein